MSSHSGKKKEKLADFTQAPLNEERAGNEKKKRPSLKRIVPKKNIKSNKAKRKRHGIFRKLANIFKKSENEKLNLQLEILNDTSKSDEKRIEAARSIVEIFYNEPSTIAQIQCRKTLEIFRDALQGEENSIGLKEGAASALASIFKYAAYFSFELVGIIAPALWSIIKDQGSGKSELRRYGFLALSALHSSANIDKSNSQVQGTLLCLDEIIYAQKGNNAETKANALDLAHCLFFRGNDANRPQLEAGFAMAKYIAENEKEISVVCAAINFCAYAFVENSAVGKNSGDVKSAFKILELIVQDGSKKYRSGDLLSAVASIVSETNNQILTDNNVYDFITLILDNIGKWPAIERKFAIPDFSFLYMPFCLNFKRLTKQQAEKLIDKLIAFTDNETDEETKKMALQVIHFPLSFNHVSFGREKLLLLAEKFKENADNAKSREIKMAYGGLFAKCLFANTSLFLEPMAKGFNLNPETAERMKENSPDWSNCPNNASRDFERMFEISMLHPDKDMISKLYDVNKITYFGEICMDILMSMYKNHENRTGLPIYFCILTSRRNNFGAFGSSVLTPELLEKFDVRVVQPGSDENSLALVKKIAKTLGIESKDINNSSEKFAVFAILGHGSPTGIALMKPSDEPLSLDITDKRILHEMGRYFEGNGFLMACNTASEEGDENFLDTIAELMGLKLWGSQLETGGIKVTYGEDNEITTATDVSFWQKTCCDYRNVGKLGSIGLGASDLGDGTAFGWSCKNAENTIGYEVLFSKDGEIFYKAGFVEANESGKYALEMRQIPEDAKFIRIKQKNMRLLDENGSKYYSFSYSDIVEVKSILPQDNKKLGELKVWPNPAKTHVNVEVKLNKPGKAKVIIYNLMGQHKATVIDGELAEGKYAKEVDLARLKLASGIYFCQLLIGGKRIKTWKFSVVK